MSQYYNPVSDVTEGRVGRPLHTSNYNQAVRQLRTGEHLYALGDRLIFKQVVCVDEKSEFDDYYGQYSAGHLVRFQLFALDEQAHQRALGAVI